MVGMWPEYAAAHGMWDLAPLSSNPEDKAGSGEARIIMGGVGFQRTYTGTEQRGVSPWGFSTFQ